MILWRAERSAVAVTVAAVTAALAFPYRTVDAACEGKGAPEITWAQTSNRIYIDAGCATMAAILAFRSDKFGAKGPLYHFDQANNVKSDTYTGVFYMESNIHIRYGATLEIDGNGDDGCTTLLLASNSTLTGSNSLNIRAHGGNLIVQDTKIFSWDIEAGDYDRNMDDGRAYLSALTEFITGRTEDTCPSDTRAGEAGYSTGKALNHYGIARMDIYASEIGYLGYDASESYGVSYKARGLCKTLENLDIFDDDQNFPDFGGYAVYGDIYDSKLHHMWFGHYSFGHQGGKWINNEVYENEGYGFDPHDDSDNLEIRGNKVWGNGNHGIIASKRCTDIVIADNEVWDNDGNGIMLHRSCNKAVVSGNIVKTSGDTGIALFESSDCVVHDNTFEDNYRGMRWSQGANRNKVYNNTVKTGSEDDYALYLYAGNDQPEAEDNPDGHPRHNEIYRNEIWSEIDVAWRCTEADDNEFYENTFHTGSLAVFEECTNNLVRDNIFSDSIFDFELTSSCFATGTDVLDLPLCDSTEEGSCLDGIEGIDGDGVVCCPLGCGQCGGKGCSKSGAANGLDGDSCCSGGVRARGDYCDDTKAAPCIYGSEADEDGSCLGGIEGIDGGGVVCCPLGCGKCGGKGCNTFGAANGLDGDSCCSGGVKASGVYCDVTNAAPCIYR